MTDVYKLYAFAHSLYSGRARSYLIKSGIPFRELSTGHESYKAEVLPKGKVPTIPTLVTPQGEVVRDGAKIIEHFEAASGRPFLPKTPRQQIVSAIFDLIGTEGLMRPAMHYRWNFLDENEAFSHYHFLYSQRDMPQREEKTRYMMGKMQSAAVMFGVSDDSKSLVETLYREFLSALNQHLTEQPYLLGWKPCIGDFGLLAPMYAHLGRDPMPSTLMKQTAVRVYRWVERMNRADQDAPEFFDAKEDYLVADEIPDTLVNVLRIIAEDLVPETHAQAEVINQWLADNQPQPGTPAQGRLAEGVYGPAEFSVRGQSLTSITGSYRFVMLQRVQQLYAALDTLGQTAVEELLETCGLSQLLAIKLDRRLGWSDNQDVWL
ncbi:MAG: glutathione S-transferase family protein [Gammaproteobacteria bacterium]|nr:glutathione S-transferase family protein [Gammaproteobacteria bacterium]